MNIVAILGSPRGNAHSSAIVSRLLTTATQQGATSRAFELNSLNYRGCQGCYACKTRLDHCVLKDDLEPVLEAVRHADAVVMSSPVYYGDITAQLKGFIDRTFSYLVPDYHVNPQPSRLPAGKKLVMVITQGHPDESYFADIFPRYETFLRWQGFADARLIRVCGIGPTSPAEKLEPALRQAEDLASWLCASSG